jgi:signal transduction histidine kinase
MTGAAGRMQRLIRDLLDYSRSNHVELDIQDIDFSALVAEIVTDFELDLTACGGRVECDNRETVRADPVLLRQLLHNLIGNAVKYRSADRSLVVRLVLEREGTDRWLLHIHDNGIGFSAKYSDQIFKVFKRLHSRAEFPGTGVGLAMCHRIADRHGGQIWADSVPGCGASFHVSLPRAPEDIYAPMRGPD